MLEKTSTRKMFRQVKDDTSSLYVQRDSTSIYSRCTDNLSKISKIFEFDRELFISRVYEKVLRGSLKDTVGNMRREQPQPYVVATTEEIDKNKLIKREPRKHVDEWRYANVLLLGSSDCTQIFIKSMKIAHSDSFTHKERLNYQEVVMNIIISVVDGMVWILKNGDIDLDDTVKMHAEVLSQELEKIQTGDGKITIEGANAVKGLWEYKQLVKKLLDSEINIPNSSP